MHPDKRPRAANPLQIDCNNCSLGSLCFPRGLKPREVARLTQAVRRGRTLDKGGLLYRRGDRFRGLFAIRAGSAKIVTSDAQGREHILDILLPGELLGFDALATDAHHCSAVALETVSYCELPERALEHLCTDIPGLSRALFRHAGERFDDDVNKIVLNKRPAKERLASFLLGLSERLHRRGFSPVEFRLTLTRQEIGNHLDLALATVSRVLRQFQEEGLLEVSHKSVHILDIEVLRTIAR